MMTMTRFFLTLTLTLLFASMSSAASAASPTGAQAVDEAWRKAIVANDLHAVMSNYSNNDLIPMLKLENDEAIFARRAAHLAKADLVTQMVTEMTSLQGIIGKEYALRSGEQKDVAEAIGEQYQPVPKSRPGLTVALADRLDSLVGLFAAGAAPTGAKDPFGLRRAAIGIVQPLIEHNVDFDLDAAVNRLPGNNRSRPAVKRKSTSLISLQAACGSC